MIRNPIRSSILVAALAVVISFTAHMTGIVVLFDPVEQAGEEGAPEPANSAAFEDFAEEALQPEEPEPEPVEEVQPEEVIVPDESNDIQVASDNPQDVEAPDTGSEAQNIGRIEPTEEVTATAPPAQGAEVLTAEGAPDAAPETAAVEAEEIIEATEPEVTDAIDEAIAEALEETPEIETVEDGEVQIAAVTRSPRPPTRPTDEAFGIENGEGETQDQSGVESAAPSQQSGLDILAQAGNVALYGRSSLEAARSAGNSTQTNYRGEVLVKLNRSLRVYKNEKGFAVIRFQILPNGQVGWVRIIRSGGSPNINIAAAANVRQAAPFPRPPNGEPVEISLTFQSR
ncbi:MAG: TonB family protein [Pseudomonadota bacterium]